MKKFLIVILSLSLIAGPALADPDLAAMSAEELTQLRKEINIELASRDRADKALATWTVPDGIVSLLEIKKGLTSDGTVAFSLRFSFTNTSDAAASLSHDTQIYIYQNGAECEWAFVNDSSSLGRMSRVLPGGTYDQIIYGIVPSDTSGAVEVEVCAIARNTFPSAGVFTFQLPSE